MKKSIVSVALLLGIAFSCKDSFLETAPYGSTNEAVLSSNEKGADALLIAAYSNLDGFSGWENGTPWGSAASAILVSPFPAAQSGSGRQFCLSGERSSG